MKRKMLIFFSALSLAVCAADTNDVPLVTVNGRTLTNVYLGSFNATGVWLWQRGGGGGYFKLADLPPEIQARCHYDPAAAVQLNTQAQAAALARLTTEKAKKYRMVENQEIAISSLTNLNGKVEQVLKKYGGISLRLYVAVYLTVPGDSLSSMGGFVGGAGSPAGYTSQKLGEKIVFVQCETDGLVDDANWNGQCLRKGEFTYTNAQGALRTLERYVASTPFLLK